MKNRLSRLIALISIGLTAISLAIFFYVFYQHSYNLFTKDLQIQGNKLALYLNNNGGIDYQIFDLFEPRITLISNDGVILFDSEAENLDNHLDRIEIQNALINGTSTSIRYSSTLDKRTYYYAIKLNDGNVLRISNGTDSMFSYISDYVLVVLIALLILYMVLKLSSKFLDRIIKPINELDLENPQNNDTYVEIAPLLDKLQQHNQLKKEFSANVSHELKTPLQSIMGYSELMLLDMVKPEDIKDFNYKINHEAKRLLMIIEDIIKISALDENQINHEFVIVDYKDMLEKIISINANFARQNHILIIPSLKNVSGYAIPSIIYEILNNLINNAIKYNKTDGKVWIALYDDDKDIKIIIKDNGIGIKNEDLSLIFERFYRVDKSHSSLIPGSGLGLSIVKYGIKLHNGSINVESTLNKGTQFTITIPKLINIKDNIS